MKRKVKIFGKSIPLSVLLLVLVVSVAAAVFSALYSATINVTSGSGPTGSLSALECSMLSRAGAMVRVIKTCEITGSEITINASGLDDDSGILVHLRYSADTDQILTFTCPDPLPAGLSSCSADPTTGQSFPAGSPNQINTTLLFYDLTPGQVVEEFVFSLEFNE